MNDYWVIQSKPGDKYVRELMQGLNAVGLNYEFLFLPLFSTELPPRPDFESVVFYGATTTTYAAYQHPDWCNTVWYHPELFRWSNLAEVWNELMLVPYWSRQTFDTLDVHGDRFFVRPDYDLKEFEGHITSADELKAWADRLYKIIDDSPSLTPSTPIIIAPEIDIAREWRTFIVDGEIAGMSRYRTYGKLDPVREDPIEVVNLVKEAVEIYQPADVFVMDVGVDLERGKYGIIEVNCFNSSEWYDVDIAAVISAINNRKNK